MRGVDGAPLVALPRKVVEIRYLTLSEAERDIYTALSNFSRKRLMELRLIGKADYLHVFKLVLRLRQLCDHPSLLMGPRTSSSTSERLSMDLKELLANFSASSPYLSELVERMQAGAQECPLCLEELVSGVLLECFHFLCRPCAEEFVGKCEEQGRAMECPVCRVPFTQEALLQVSNRASVTAEDGESIANAGGERAVRVVPMEAIPHSTKLDTLVQELKSTHAEGSEVKSIVFSQWTGMLDLIGAALKREGISMVRLDGSLSQKRRWVRCGPDGTPCDGTILPVADAHLVSSTSSNLSYPILWEQGNGHCHLQP
jgi:SNF2 family DNA or RNA helicase